MKNYPVVFFSGGATAGVTIPSGASQLPRLSTAGMSGADYMVRLQFSKGTLAISGAETRALAEAFRKSVESAASSFDGGCRVLGAVIDRLKIRENYNLHYRDFLLGQMSEQEFEAVAEQFAYTPKIVELGELARNVQVLFDYTREEFTSSEVAELFRVTQDDVEQALRQMPLLLTGGSVIHADT